MSTCRHPKLAIAKYTDGPDWFIKCEACGVCWDWEAEGDMGIEIGRGGDSTTQSGEARTSPSPTTAGVLVDKDPAEAGEGTDGEH